MIDDGLLPHGWTIQYAINDVQCDACALGMRICERHQHTSYMHNNKPYSKPRNLTGSSDGKIEYSRYVDGKPCHQWNWGNECSFTGSHGQHPDRRLQVCAWCAIKYQWINLHQEQSAKTKRVSKTTKPCWQQRQPGKHRFFTKWLPDHTTIHGGGANK